MKKWIIENKFIKVTVYAQNFVSALAQANTEARLRGVPVMYTDDVTSCDNTHESPKKVKVEKKRITYGGEEWIVSGVKNNMVKLVTVNLNNQKTTYVSMDSFCAIQ